MKKNITKFIFFILLIFSSIVAYLSIIGIETDKFNNQISSLVKNINKDLNIELKKIKLVLDPINFQINVKTIGPNLKIKENRLDIENIKTVISINSYLKKKFSFTNLEISTNSIEIKELIYFLRNINNSPELFILEKVIKKGHLISNISLEFDEEGRIKDNYNIKGFIKDGKLSILKKYNIKKTNFLFNISKNNYLIEDVDLTFNNTPLASKKINIEKIKDNFLIEGSFRNKETKVKKEILDIFFNSFSTKYDVNNLDLNLNNNFSFKLNKNFRISNLQLSSKILVNNLDIKNNLALSKFFPKIKKVLNIKNHVIDIVYDKNSLSINGNGNILLQEKENNIEYLIIKKAKQIEFKTSLSLEGNPFKIDLLGYEKEKNLDALIKIEGTLIPKKRMLIKSASFIENDNKFHFKKLVFDQSFSISNLEKVNLKYKDKDKNRNNLNLEKKDDRFFLSGTEFNVDYLMENFINNNSKNDFSLINKDFDLNINIKKVHLDGDYKINKLLGNLNFKNEKILNADINGFFSEKEKIKLTINTNNNDEKILTLFTNKAEPLVKRYKFIKGFRNGSLDFYSVTKGDKSKSTLKIYNFNLKELPILTKILTLASLQGIADILSGEGITFNELEMNFNSKKNGIEIDELYAIGPAISILMDGYYVKDELISLRGTLVPATTINKFVSSIPILGNILVGKKTGEGVFGVSFKIKGPPKNLKTSVNPIKTLTPRFITRTLEKIKKN